MGPNVKNDPIHYLAENGKFIGPSTNTKLLGIIINNKLSWGDHLFTGKNSIKSFINLKLGAMNKICRSMTKNLKLKMIGPIINSKISYIIQCWGNINKTELRLIQTCQNKAAHRVLN